MQHQILNYCLQDLQLYIEEEDEIVEFAYERNKIELYQLSSRDSFYCADCFLIKLDTIDSTELVADFLNHSATYNTLYELDAEEVGDHIRDNIHHTDFCSVCKRWSFIYIADAQYYDPTVVINTDTFVTDQIRLYAHSANGTYEE
jgi:hypothetical protein